MSSDSEKSSHGGNILKQVLA